MSHVTASKSVVSDLDCLKAVLKEKFPQLQWMEGQKTYAWFGEFLADWKDTERTAGARGVDPSQFGHCEHAIRLPGCTYEIGVTKRQDGTGYSLVWDIWKGAAISEYIGQDGEKLMTEYARGYCLQHAQEQGLMVNESSDEEFLYLEMQS